MYFSFLWGCLYFNFFVQFILFPMGGLMISVDTSDCCMGYPPVEQPSIVTAPNQTNILLGQPGTPVVNFSTDSQQGPQPGYQPQLGYQPQPGYQPQVLPSAPPGVQESASFVYPANNVEMAPVTATTKVPVYTPSPIDTLKAANTEYDVRTSLEGIITAINSGDPTFTRAQVPH
jgi:hypothetical protein